MRGRGLLLGLLLPCLTTACAGPPSVGEAASEIIGGTVTTGDPAVVLLISYPADLSTYDTCTASVIAPTVLLTAAHCVDATDHPGYLFGAFTGPDASAYPTIAELAPMLAAGKEAHVHPDYDPSAPFHADLGVVVLKEALAITPLPVNRGPLGASVAGEAARIVGYGQTVYQEFNLIKHQASTVVVSLGVEDTIIVGDDTHRSCIGDSGGPALVKLDGVETIVGVDSYTETTGCLEPANYRRPDLYLPFLDTYAPPPVDAGADGGGEGDGGATTGPTASKGCAVGGREGGGGEGAGLVAMVVALGIGRRRRR